MSRCRYAPRAGCHQNKPEQHRLIVQANFLYDRRSFELQVCSMGSISKIEWAHSDHCDGAV
ncbi:hypothetical protein SERLA73DRAFT_175709 [Serpula lacrymans var. lacrymans S7.3]|uniref:Uncharacterized protein n=2 Tax=Serpula lacrymans var. lacrymans TaxID=341189 RepID=F8PL86_SERL3|nr:uncharacterized protein SERLADRAFT_458279 [Serpula lacrymans var. lacrymans S7.9]EGO03994.1 hypothetical protein SERLA73DRAFT_175709 [Serpula lacrymans var. lacrymans S7.3]EGO29914.1 hypothetical protein SERLADRAFT_458279 [Serpula lacrymans var. lacrymans S7.9]